MNAKLYILLLFSSFGFTQKIETTIDRKQNKIGEQFTLSLKVKSNTKRHITFPKDKNFGSFEVVESYPIDTIKAESKMELIKKYGLVQFDSGKFVIPKMPILINNKPYFSESIKVEVFNVKVDTLKQKMYDIKPIIEAERPLGNWWKYLLGLLTLIGLGFLGYKLYKKYQKTAEIEPVYSTPIEKSIDLLQRLEKKNF